MKILTVAGTRPQLVKIAPVSHVLRQHVTEVLVNTGQHYDYKLSGVFFNELNIPQPNYDLECGSASHGKQTGAMLGKIEEVIINERPHAVLVYGDTNSTLAGALAASKLGIPIFHIEAGLRSFNKTMPEEINRVLTDHISSLLLVPTETAVKNLEREGITSNVINTGDVMYDAFLNHTAIAEERYSLDSFRVTEKNYILATIHRPYNTDQLLTLTAIVEAFEQMEEPVLFPVHPRTKYRLQEYGLYDRLCQSRHIQVIPPISYLEMLLLENKAKAIITDSGGVQKEAYFAKVPCFTLRPETEWTETVKAGCNQLVNIEKDNLAAIIQTSISKGDFSKQLFGDGKASERIVKEILNYLQ